MDQWLEALGHSMEEINGLNIIHIAGTKGKGSTCAFVESFLRAHGQRTGNPPKTGLYTSPHLIVPEERIRINSHPLDRALFAKYFFEVFDKLPQLASEYDSTKQDPGPRYLQLFALFAFHVLLREEVDVTIVETHNGGEYDATTVVQRPVVTAITTLGMDHVDMLGPSVKNIAWHKSGIYKSGSIALSTMQDPAPAQVLRDRARDKGEEVRFVGEDSRLPLNALALKPKVQRKNASLAVAIVEAYLRRRGPTNFRSLTAEDIRLGIEQWSWPGRFQIIHDGQRTWFLDAAHNEMSVVIAAQWFAECGPEIASSAMRILIFSHINELRDAGGLLDSLAQAMKNLGLQIAHVIFTTYDESEESTSLREPTNPGVFHRPWKKSMPNSKIWDEPTVQGAIRLAKKLASEDSCQSTQVLITGSQRLVGPSLRILQSKS
jgi:folylpolyglutamate synthase